jgi:hypothetical protein
MHMGKYFNQYVLEAHGPYIYVWTLTKSMGFCHGKINNTKLVIVK